MLEDTTSPNPAASDNQTLPGQAMRSLCPGRRVGSMCGALTPSHYPQTPAWGSRTQRPPLQSGPGFCSVRYPPFKTERAAGPHLPAATHYGPMSRPCHHEGGGRGSEQGCPHPGVGTGGTLSPQDGGGRRGGAIPKPSSAASQSTCLSPRRTRTTPHFPRVLSGSTAHIWLFCSGWKVWLLWFIP